MAATGDHPVLLPRKLLPVQAIADTPRTKQSSSSRPGLVHLACGHAEEAVWRRSDVGRPEIRSKLNRLISKEGLLSRFQGIGVGSWHWVVPSAA